MYAITTFLPVTIMQVGLCRRIHPPPPPHFPYRSGDLRMQKLKSHSVRTQSINVLSLKPVEGQYRAIHAMLTARDFFLAYFYPSDPFTCIFSKPLLISPVLAVARHGSCVGPQNEIGHPAGCRFPCCVPTEYKYCLLYTSPSPRDCIVSRMPSSA